MKKSLVVKIAVLIVVTVILSALLTAIVFSYSGKIVFANLKADELEPRAEYIALLTRDYLTQAITRDEFRRGLGYEYSIWDAALYIYDSSREIFVWPTNEDPENRDAIELYLGDVFAGNSVVYATAVKHVGVVIGEPVYDGAGNVIAAVFLIKPLREVSAALNGLIVALVISMLGVAAIMAAPAYFASKTITRPLNQMTEVAVSMAHSDFSVRADEGGDREIAQLGRALNYLSSELSNTIAALKLERNRLRSTVDGLGEGIISVSESGEIIHFNPSAVRILGGKPGLRNLGDLASYAAVHEAILGAMASGKDASLEMEVGEASVRVTVTPLFGKDNSIAGVVALIQDITESIRLEQTRRDYVANVSHELRTPIASIRSLADALNDNMVKKEADRARYYGYILKESMRLSRLIDDLLELSRLQSNSVALTKQRMDVSELCEDMSLRYMDAAKERGLSFFLHLPEERMYAFSNPDRVEQVLVALLDNAIKYAEEQGGIELSLREDEGKIFVSVKNDAAVSDEEVKHLFERFYKADRSHSGNGTGLGLAIASETMARMGERIWAENGEGKIEFIFTLERAEK